MTEKKYYFAVDLGATSGRTILGILDNGRAGTGGADTLSQQPD